MDIGILFAKYCDVKDLQEPHQNALSQDALVKLIEEYESNRHETRVSQKNAPGGGTQLYFISYSFWQYTYDDSKLEGDTVEGFENTVEDCHIERFEDVEALEDKLRKRLGYDGLTIINYIKIN